MPDSKTDRIPEHESPVRRIVADSSGEEYGAIKSFSEAKKIPNAYVVFEGDYGGQIYLTCPMSKIKCNEKTLKQLLYDIDACCFDYFDSTGIYYEVHQAYEGIAGGMGGGITKTDIWIHPKVVELEIASQIKQVINGERNRINVLR